MKTRKRIKKRKGGFLGIRALKTKSENRANCHRLAEKFKERHDFLVDKYKCATSDDHKKACKVIDKKVGLNEQCERNHQMINDFDFSRDGLHLKQRLQPFFGSTEVPVFVNEDLWSEMPYHFKKRPNALKEYDLKTEDEITKKYNEEN